MFVSCSNNYICINYHIDFGVGVPHIAHNATILHTVKLLSGHYVLVSYQKQKFDSEKLAIYFLLYELMYRGF